MKTASAPGTELVLAGAVAVLLMAMTAALGWRLTASAKLTEVYAQTGPAQIDQIEHFARTGRWTSSAETVNEPSARESGMDSRSEMAQLGLAFRTAATRAAFGLAAEASGHTPGWLATTTPRAQTRGPGTMRSGVIDGAIVVVGRVGRSEQTYSWITRPAVQVNDVPMVVAWVCGGTEPGSPWIAAALPPGADSWNDLRTDYWCRSEALQ